MMIKEGTRDAWYLHNAPSSTILQEAVALIMAFRYEVTADGHLLKRFDRYECLQTSDVLLRTT